jgi:hypothetical protein
MQVVRHAEGTSPWYACGHDEFALVMDGKVEISLLKPDRVPVPADRNGAVALDGAPAGRAMGRIVAGRGHMALLPGRRLPVPRRDTVCRPDPDN